MPAEAALPSFADLQRELSPISPRAWRFAALRTSSRAGALLSDGLRIGYRHGFDSGPFMAHVYADRAAGRTRLGRRLDRRLLDRATCQAFRDIRGLAERAVVEAIEAAGDAPLVADLAAGPSPYLLHALQQHPGASAVLCDTDPAALEQAAAAARALGVANRVSTRRASAFDRDALAALRPRPDVVCELGLYGIYHDDALIERHFLDLAETVAPGQIVCNVQVDNPEIEYIARVWRNAAGGRCVWRLRPQEQIEGYARAAGYEAASVTADRHDIYRVMRFVRRDGAPAQAPAS
jgi:putative methyltransferase